MKKFPRSLALSLCLAMTLSLASCGGKSENANSPEISGVEDMSISVGTEFDAMAGISAWDVEDGDLTSRIVVESLPALSFVNGKATPEASGTYELTYTVTDKGGLETKAYATLTATRQTGEATVLKKMDFSADSAADGHGWTAKIADGVDASGELRDGAYIFDITDPGNGDGDIQLVKSGIALKAADYKVKVWAKASKNTYAHILARDESADDWATFGGAYNVAIGTEISPLEMNFTSSGEGSTELMINLGKITPNPDNSADTTPQQVTVTIDKIEIYEISGSQTKTPVYEMTEFENAAISAGDGASASVSAGDDGAVFQLENYPTDGGVWSIKADLLLPDVKVEAGEKYYYSFTVVSDNDQDGECLVESASMADAARANFNGLSIKAGEETVITNVFTAENSVDDPVIRMQIGNPAEGVTKNTIRVSKVEFGKVEGNLETNKTIDAFGSSISANANPDVLWTTYNGTDEDNDLGVGTIWTDDNKLFYRIDQGGTVDWHNKLILGHRDNPLTLPADSYFTVEITAKATQPVSCGFFLNPMGEWDPRVSEGIDLTTEEKTFTFKTTDTLIMDMDFEMLFQFGSADTAAMDGVTIEISDITIYQESII